MVVPYYAPDLGPSAPLFTMLSEALVKRGHQVTAITTVPHYPSGQVADDFTARGTRSTQENGVNVIRVGLPSVMRSNLALRLFQFFIYQVGAVWASRGLQYDAVFVANPALWVWLPFTWLVVLRRKPAIFSVHDLYPEVGIQLGIFRNKAVISAVTSLERFCLNHSNLVRILSDSFRSGLHALGVTEEKMVLIYDWVDTELIRPIPRDNHFTRENDLSDYFVVLYAGNIGLSQGLEHVLTAAELLKDQSEIRFVFVGDGAVREQLVSIAKGKKLSNVQFLPFQPRQRLPEVLSCADVSLVSLKRGIGSGSLPSKTFSILASGRPILACVDENSDTWNLVRRSESGLCLPPEDPKQLAEAILNLKQNVNLRQRLGKNGRSWAEKYHSPQSAAEQFEVLFESILKANRSKIVGQDLSQ